MHVELAALFIYLLWVIMFLTPNLIIFMEVLTHACMKFV